MSGKSFKEYVDKSFKEYVDKYEINKKIELEEIEKKLLFEYQEKRRKILSLKKLSESYDPEKILLYVKYIFDKVDESECDNYYEIFSDNSLYFLNKTTMEIFSRISHCPDKDCKDCFSRSTLKFCLRDFPPSEWRNKLKL